MATEPHNLTLEPQPIADQWMGKCSCGWRCAASTYEFHTKDELLSNIYRQHAVHSIGEKKE